MISSNVSSMMAHTQWMNANSSNVANVNTKDYKAFSTVLENESNAVDASSSKGSFGTDIAKEMTDQVVLTKGFEANSVAIKSEDEMLGSLLDIVC